MNQDPLNQLAEMEVPPLPADFRQQVRRQLNHWLLVVHLMDFVLHAVPYAIGALVPAVGGLVRFSLTGKYSSPHRPDEMGPPAPGEDRTN